MDIPTVCLLLKQGDRSLEDHTKDFLDLVWRNLTWIVRSAFIYTPASMRVPRHA